MYLAKVTRAAMREIGGVARGDTRTHRHLRALILALVVITAGVDLVCAALALLFERHAPNTQLDSYGSALFWTSTQLLTVSSQIQNPFTVGGRILDVFMEAYSISVVATLAGSMGAFLLRRGREIEQADQAEDARTPEAGTAAT